MRRAVLSDLFPPEDLDDDKANPSFAKPRLNLPIDDYEDEIVDSVTHHAITIVASPTGSGKSSRIPFMLHKHFQKRVMCTQPRRLAAVSLAKRVAQEWPCGVGGDEVGYHIGQRKVCHGQTRIVFATAGILFETLRTKGLANLDFDILCLDEVHERSVDSDLVMACLRLLLCRSEVGRNSSFRLLIMSATLDIPRYQAYFQVADDAVIRLPEHISILSFRPTQTLYLENIMDALPSDLVSLKHVYSAFIQGASSSSMTGGGGAITRAGIDRQDEMSSPNLSYQEVVLIGAIIRHIIARAPANDQGSILVFLPIYRHIEMALNYLSNQKSLPIRLYALHSSVDVEQCVSNIHASVDVSSKNDDNHRGTEEGFRRSVILTSNIAESSVTIENCGYVIDSCRTIEMKWQEHLQKYQSSIVWCSKSQSNQRKGRTGRTCSGTVYRLVPRKFFELELSPYETPSIVLSSLYNETLSLVCSQNGHFRQIHKVYKLCMDTPELSQIDHALDYLQRLNCCSVLNASQRRQISITPMGEFMGHFPFEIEATQLILLGYQRGVLLEAILLASILRNSPFPLMQYLEGRDNAVSETDGSPGAAFNVNPEDPLAFKRNIFTNSEILQLYGYAPVNSKDFMNKRIELLLANLVAVQFYLHTYDRVQKWKRLAQDLDELNCTNPVEIMKSVEAHHDDMKFWEIPIEEQQWCRRHHLIPDAIRSILSQVDLIIGIIHCFRPVGLNELLYPNMQEFYGNRVSTKDVGKTTNEDGGGPAEEDSNRPLHQCASSDPTKYCSCEDYLEYLTIQPDQKKRILTQMLEDILAPPSAANDPTTVSSTSPNDVDGFACTYFLRGHCRIGERCSDIHSTLAPRRPCQYGSECTYGLKCTFGHPERKKATLSHFMPKPRTTTATYRGFAQEMKSLAFEWSYHKTVATRSAEDDPLDTNAIAHWNFESLLEETSTPDHHHHYLVFNELGESTTAGTSLSVCQLLLETIEKTSKFDQYSAPSLPFHLTITKAFPFPGNASLMESNAIESLCEMDPNAVQVMDSTIVNPAEWNATSSSNAFFSSAPFRCFPITHCFYFFPFGQMEDPGDDLPLTGPTEDMKRESQIRAFFASMSHWCMKQHTQLRMSGNDDPAAIPQVLTTFTNDHFYRYNVYVHAKEYSLYLSESKQLQLPSSSTLKRHELQSKNTVVYTFRLIPPF